MFSAMHEPCQSEPALGYCQGEGITRQRLDLDFRCLAKLNQGKRGMAPYACRESCPR
jgi:hypothetical protein